MSVYLAGIAGLLGLMSATGTAASKKLIKKAEKHEKTVSLAEAKHRSICRLVSKACQGGSISDGEFASIMSKVKQYYDLKAKVIKCFTKYYRESSGCNSQRRDKKGVS